MKFIKIQIILIFIFNFKFIDNTKISLKVNKRNLKRLCQINFDYLTLCLRPLLGLNPIVLVAGITIFS